MGFAVRRRDAVADDDWTKAVSARITHGGFHANLGGGASEQ